MKDPYFTHNDDCQLAEAQAEVTRQRERSIAYEVRLDTKDTEMARLRVERDAAEFATRGMQDRLQRLVDGAALKDAEIRRLDAEIARLTRVSQRIAREGTTFDELKQRRKALAVKDAEIADWILIADGIKHDHRCPRHFGQDALETTPLCLRCQCEDATTALAAEREKWEALKEWHREAIIPQAIVPQAIVPPPIETAADWAHRFTRREAHRKSLFEMARLERHG